MATTRSYEDRCGVARALDVIGERWSLLIVRELLFGPKRFNDLRVGLPRVTPAVLSDRLRELQASGLLRRETLAPPAASTVYELTDRGRELEPIVLALGRWGSAQPVAEGSEMSVDSHALALRTLFSSRKASGRRLSVELLLEGQALSIDVADDELLVQRGSDRRAEATMALDRGTLRDLLWGGRSLREAIASGAVEAAGDLAAAELFLTLFPRPASAGSQLANSPDPTQSPAPSAAAGTKK